MIHRQTVPGLTVLMLAGWIPCAGQSITGRVVDGSTGNPVGAGFIVLINEAGQEIARSLTNQDGTFDLRPPSPGRYRLRSERIAFRSATTVLFSVPANGRVPVEIRITALPRQLEPISIVDSTECVLRPEEGRRVATLWAEAQKALEATAWTAREGAYGFRIEKRRSELDRDLDLRDEDLDTIVVNTTQPFRTATPEELMEEGFLRSDGGDVVFEGLDAQVFLSGPFLDTHCFLARAGTNDSVVGITFQPVASRATADVEGVLWLDSQTFELRSLEFGYVGLPGWWPEIEIGGRTDFIRLEDGRWIVWRWKIRVPRFRARRMPPRLTGYYEDGARVLSVLVEKRN